MIGFRFFGVEVELRFPFVAVLALCTLLDQTQIALYGLLASLLHESGHLAALALCGCRPQRISFELTGIALTKSDYTLSYRKEAVVLAAGSAVNFLFFFAFWCAAGSLERVSAFAAAHLILGCVNLLPVSALDGGKLLRLALMQAVSEQAAERFLFILQIVIILVLTTFCILSALQGVLNFTLVVLLFYLISMVLTA